MDKKGKIIIAVSVLIVLIIIGVAIYFGITKNNSGNNGSGSTEDTRLANIYQKMSSNNVYNVSMSLDDNNKIITKRKGDIAKVESYNNGQKSTYIVKDGNTYFLVDDEKKYYEYKNNEIKLTELLLNIKDTMESQVPQEGTEEIDGEKYNYEEYKNVAKLSLKKNYDIDESKTSTKFYFDGKELKFIKTVIDGNEELVRVEISYDVNDSDLEIPSDYTEG